MAPAAVTGRVAQRRLREQAARVAAIPSGRTLSFPSRPACAAQETPFFDTARRAFAGGFHGAHRGGRGRSSAPDRFYTLLGVEKGASDTDIKKAYKKQAKTHHPDMGGDEAVFKDISRAYEVLSDPQKKQMYDQFGEEELKNMENGGGGGGGGPQGGMDPFDMFQDIFGFKTGAKRGPPSTPDAVYELELTLEEFFKGTSRKVKFARQVLCKSCDGLGGTNTKQCGACQGAGRQVKLQQVGMFVQQVEQMCGSCRGKGYQIPPGCQCKICKGAGLTNAAMEFDINIDPGSEEGTQYTFKGKADEAPGHQTGNVVVVLRQRAHKIFQRIKENLVIEKKLSLAEALCGFEISTKFLDGNTLTVRPSAGEVLKPGSVLVVERKGMPRQHGQKPGHLFVHVQVEFPERLSVEQQGQLRTVLGGGPLSGAASASTGAVEEAKEFETARKLSKRQADDLMSHFAQIREQKRQERQGGQGQQVHPQQCAQQ